MQAPSRSLRDLVLGLGLLLCAPARPTVAQSTSPTSMPTSAPTSMPSAAGRDVQAAAQPMAAGARARPARLDAWVGAWVDAWAAESVGGHGWVIAGIEARLPRATLTAELNTDTVTLRVEGAPGPIRFATWLRAEAFAARVLNDGVFAGERIDGAAFLVSYAELGQDAHIWLGGPHTLGVEAAGRRVIAAPGASTDPALALPADPWNGHVLVRYVVDTTASRSTSVARTEPWDLVDGLRGVVEVGARLSSQQTAWGAASGDVTRADPRNAADVAGALVRGEAGAGSWVSRVIGLDARLTGGWVGGGDDLERPFSGGLSPFGVPLAARPWGSVRVDRWAAGDASVRLRCGRIATVSGFAQATAVADPERARSGEWGVGVAAGTALDISTPAWHADVRLAVSPRSPWSGDNIGWAALGGVAWRLPVR